MKPELGVCYYPEHWDETLWAKDAARMVETGITWVRIAEFSWSRLEPVAGQFNFDWLDKAIGILAGAWPENRDVHADCDTAALDDRTLP